MLDSNQGKNTLTHLEKFFLTVAPVRLLPAPLASCGCNEYVSLGCNFYFNDDLLISVSF